MNETNPIKWLGIEISYDELMNAWAPLVDVSMALDRIGKKAGGNNAGGLIGFMDDKVKRALEPLKECLDRIQKENPGQFSEADSLRARDGPKSNSSD